MVCLGNRSRKGEIIPAGAFVAITVSACGKNPQRLDVYKRQGLGLAITRNIVLLHQGAIKLSSKEGEGTRCV